ncbi:zinc finger protein 646 [Eleutherodactylus coqui]|uniref:zinc finger protein 646 n=1 Tax=Eleutherodactylus coqui TaxID=57060 RepID=UPI003463414A
MNMDDGTDQADGSTNQNLNSDQCPMSLSGLTELESHQESPKEDRPYKCNQCDKSYRHAGSLVNHKKTHQIGLYTCLICQKEYSNPMGLKSHLRTHSEEKRFKCEQCGEAFRMSQQLYNHRKSLHGYSTPNGEKITRSPKFEVQAPVLVESSNLMSNLENYIAESMLPVDFPHLVSKCYPDEKAGEEDLPIEDVEGHEVFTDEKDQPNDSNIEEYRYKCNQCGKAYKHAGSLANHKQSHVIGLYQCAVCFKEFSNLMAMKNHCRLHSDARARRSCKSPRFSGKSTGVYIDGADPPQIEVLLSAEKANNPPSLPDLSENIKSEEEEEAILIPQTHYKDEPVSSLSPLAKPNTDDMTDTPVCSDSITERTNDDENKEKPNDFLVEQLEYDDAHEEDPKSGDRPFKCQECEKTYRHAGSLINHKKTHQTGVYSCSLCSKQMFNMAALKNHLRAHFKSRAGRRLGDAYFPSVSLSDELYQNQEDSYQCGLCDDISTNESDFLQHQLLHQKQEINEMSHEKLAEDIPKAGIWQETPQVSQGSSDDSAYSSGPGFTDVIKIQKDKVALQQWSQDYSLATPHEVKIENQDANVQNADASFEEPQPDLIASKEAESSELEEHHQSIDDRPHKCEICGRTYRHKSSLINHKLTHKTGVYQCSLCPKQYPNLMALRNHVRFHSRSYAGRRGISSRLGRQFFRAKPRFLQNRNNQSLADYVKLNDEVPNAATTSNKAIEEPLNESQSHCPCGKSFDGAEHFQLHQKNCPSAITVSSAETPTNVKSEISISTSAEKDLSDVQHPLESQEKITETYKSRVYECNLCSKSYRHSGSLINHKRTHQTGDYMCPYCSKHVHNMAALKNHIRIHHKVKKAQQGELRIDHALLYSEFSYPPDRKGLYHCVSCEKMFHTENDLLAHQMLHMPLEGNQWEHQDLKSSSPEVNKDATFTGTKDADWEHSNNLNFQDEHDCIDSAEDKPSEYTCVECGEVYDHIDDLNDHKRSHQAGIYQCSFCPKEYPNLLALRSHFETHTKPQTLRNTSLDGSDRNGFVDNHLPADNHYDCGHCGLIFSNEVDFHQHQVAHEKQVMDESLTGLRGEEQEPEYSFSMHSSERELLSRIKSEIEETDHSEANDGGSLLSHICGFCGKTYDDLESLQAHSLCHSNEEESSTNENIHTKTDQDSHCQQYSPSVKEEESSGSTAKNEESPQSRPYTCEQCGKTYRHGGSLVNHKKTHLVGNFQCVSCSRHYPNLAAYRTHLRHHPKCKQPAASSNQHELPTNDLICPSGDARLLTFSPPSSVPMAKNPARQPISIEKYVNSAIEDGSMHDHPSGLGCSNTLLNNSRRKFSRRISSINKVHNSKQMSLQSISMSGAHNVSDVQDSKVPVCEFCGKMFGVKDQALHLSGNCSHHSAKLDCTLVERNEESQDLPILPNSFSSQKEDEPGFHWRPFRCEVCGRSYRHAGSLINHKQTHKTGIFRCSICQKRFFNLMAMKNHNRIHFELKRHNCLDCGKAFRLQKQLDTHQRIHRLRASSKKLGRRKRRSRYRRFVQGHLHKSLMQVSSESSAVDKVHDSGVKSSNSCTKREMDPDSRPYQCEECGRSYRHAGSLFNHKKSHKTGQYHCSICDKTYSNLMALKNHQRTHYEAKRHPCSQCGKTFKWKRQLFKHQLVHDQERPQSVSPLLSGTEEAKTLDEHQEKNTVGHDSSSFNNEEVSNQEEISPGNKDSVSPLKPVCISCGITFTDHDELDSHACKENHIDSSAPEESGARESTPSENKDEPPHQSDVCNRNHPGNLRTQKSTQERANYKCSLCHKQFLNPIAMKAHLQTHTAEKHFQCVDCRQAFPNSQELFNHNTIHNVDKPCCCPICNHGFSCELALRHHQWTHKPLSSSLVTPTKTPTLEQKMSQSGEKLQNHKDQVNQGDRKYKCKQCGRSYIHAGSLFNHQKTHSVGVYKCPSCLKEYSNLLAFKNHLRIHRYNCKECGKAFRNSGDLEAHSKIHEGGSFTCSLCNKDFLCRSSFKRHQRVHTNQDGDIFDTQAVSNFMVEVT